MIGQKHAFWVGFPTGSILDSASLLYNPTIQSYDVRENAATC